MLRPLIFCDGEGHTRNADFSQVHAAPHGASLDLQERTQVVVLELFIAGADLLRHLGEFGSEVVDVGDFHLRGLGKVHRVPLLEELIGQFHLVVFLTLEKADRVDSPLLLREPRADPVDNSQVLSHPSA